MGVALAVYLLLILGVTPVVSRRIAASGVILQAPRPALYRAGIATSWFLALLGIAVLWWERDLGPAEIGLVGLPPVRTAAATVLTLVALAAGVAVFAGLRRAVGVPESPELRHLLPQTPGERRLFAAVALSAGITEEVVFRGIAITALAQTPLFPGTVGAWAAGVVTAVCFGLGHGYQDALGRIRAAVLGVVLAAAFLLTGSLLPGIIAHAGIDLGILLAPGRRLVEDCA